MKYGTTGTHTGRRISGRNYYIDKTTIPHIGNIDIHRSRVIEVDFAEIERKVIYTMAMQRSDWIQLYDDVREYFRSQTRVKRFDGKEITEAMDTMEREFMRRKMEGEEGD